MHQGNWSAALYLDSRGSAQQSDSLLKVFFGQAGGVPAALHPLISKVLGVKSAEIADHANGRKRQMTIRDVGESEIERWTALAGRTSRSAITRSGSLPAIRALSHAQSNSSFATTVHTQLPVDVLFPIGLGADQIPGGRGRRHAGGSVSLDKR